MYLDENHHWLKYLNFGSTGPVVTNYNRKIYKETKTHFIREWLGKKLNQRKVIKLKIFKF